MSNRFVVSFQFSVVRGWTVGPILSESRIVADNTDDADFKGLSFLDEVSQTWYIIHIAFLFYCSCLGKETPKQNIHLNEP